MISNTQLDQILNLENKISSAPWVERFWIGVLEFPQGKRCVIMGHGPIHEYKKQNDEVIFESEFIALVRNTIKPIILELKELRSKLNIQ